MTLSGSDVRATVVPRVGPVKAAFSGKETLADNRIIGEGAGGVAGFAKGGAKVRREEESPDVTILRDETEAQTGGKLAQLGSRLIDSTSRKLAANFFENFATLVAPSS
ncbi:SRPBCC domain-containing protein [Bradyrhizobium sp. CCGUVB1N3]|nr:SRPBCC domain-containing protein [Bradyrhizobium sp. CCGUVB1N3]MCP3474837.1 SRPBCC domain-containing protein [Bradyrhizobium sp. CCGUVB1N3]